MLFSIEKLQRDVMARLGEIALPQPLFDSSEIPSSADIVSLKVESLLPEAGRRLILGAPSEMLGLRGSVDTEKFMRMMPCGMYAAEILLPDGFLRLVSVRMGEWERNASSLILPDTSQWECQWSGEPGIAGCPERPKVYLDCDILRAIGSVSESDTLMHLRFWSVPKADDAGNFLFPTSLYPALVGEIAASLEPKN